MRVEPVITNLDVDEDGDAVKGQCVFHLIADLRRMGETNALAMRKKAFDRKELFTLADEIYRSHFPDADGRIIATFEVLFLTGWSPDESQQKPLRPGSARTRLADALQTDEINLNDRTGVTQGKEDTE